MYVKILLIATDRHKTRKNLSKKNLGIGTGDKHPGSGTQCRQDSVSLLCFS